MLAKLINERVVLSLPALAVPFGAETHGLAALLVLRMARLLRFLRLLHFIPNVERIIEGSKRALKASIGILLLSLFFIFLFGMAGTYLFGGHGAAGEAFADPIISMYTMFKIFTVEGWYEQSDLLASGVVGFKSHLIRFFFIVAVVFGGIVILSLLNAVFVDEMSSDIAEHTEDEMDAIKAELAAIRTDAVDKLTEISQRLAALERAGLT